MTKKSQQQTYYALLLVESTPIFSLRMWNILRYISKNPRCIVVEIQDSFPDLSPKDVSTTMLSLRKAGAIYCLHNTRSTLNIRYDVTLIGQQLLSGQFEVLKEHNSYMKLWRQPDKRKEITKTEKKIKIERIELKPEPKPEPFELPDLRPGDELCYNCDGRGCEECKGSGVWTKEDQKSFEKSIGK